MLANGSTLAISNTCHQRGKVLKMVGIAGVGVTPKAAPLYLFSFCGLPFHFLHGIPGNTNVFDFNQVPFIYSMIACILFRFSVTFSVSFGSLCHPVLLGFFHFISVISFVGVVIHTVILQSFLSVRYVVLLLPFFKG